MFVCIFAFTSTLFVVHRLNADDHIQMVTALALQLIQCVVKLPQPKTEEENQEEEVMEDVSKQKKDKQGKGKRRSGDPVSKESYIVSNIK